MQPLPLVPEPTGPIPGIAEPPVTAPVTSLHHGALAPFRHRDFALFWSGAFASNAGTWLQNVALSWLVLQITNSPFWVSMVTFSQFFPLVIFGLLGGLAADRFERRRVLIVAQSVMMTSAFGLALITLTGHASVATLLPLVALGGVAIAFNAPAFQAMIPDLVPRHLVLDAVSLNTAQLSASRVIGPILGALVLATAGAGWAFFGNGVSFLAVIAALLFIRPALNDPPASSGRRALMGGFRAVGRDPVIKILLASTAVVSLFSAPLMALLPVLARNVLHQRAGGYGMLFSIFGLGAVAGALLTGKIVRRFGIFTVVLGGMLALALASVGLGLSRNVVLSAFVLALVGFAYTTSVSATNSGLQTSVPASKRGRIMSLYMMAWAGLYPVGAVVAGVIATHIGVPATLLWLAIPLFAATVVVRFRGGVLHSVKV